MPGVVGRRRKIGACLIERAQIGDRGGQDRRLRVQRQVQIFGRPGEAELGDRLAQGLVGRPKAGSRRSRTLGKGKAHADVLRTLSGEDERDSIHWPVTLAGRTARLRTLHALVHVSHARHTLTAFMTDPLHPRDDLSPAVVAARDHIQNPRQLSDRIAMGRALWRDLVIGFAAQLAQLGVGFAQLAALYAIDGTETLTVADLAERIGRSPSATSRLVTGLETRGLVRRREEVADRRQRTLEVSADGKALLAQ